MSLARATASSSDATGYTATTGPNVSSRYTSISGVTPASTVGSKNSGPMSGRCLPPATRRAPLATASSTWALTLSSWSWEASAPTSGP